MKPTLVILAAGLGSRYGSLKQIDSYGPGGEAIIEYSFFDAFRAGFGKVVFVISPSMEADFTESFVLRFPKSVDIDYVIQDMADVPAGFQIPPDRTKPWGTAHAVMAAEKVVHEPFAVVNGDDFYGLKSFEIISKFLSSLREDQYDQFCMAGYSLHGTLSEHGTVSRGVCEVNSESYLTGIVERTKIGYNKNKEVAYYDADGTAHIVTGDPSISMNFFGFTPKFFQWLHEYFELFLKENGTNIKAEYFLPYIVNGLVQSHTASMKVLPTPESWFGVTYKEDKPYVVERLRALTNLGKYPTPLWHK